MNPIKDKLRTVTFLTRTQIDYLDNLEKDALFYQGKKLSRAQILSELVNFLMNLGVDVKKINLNKKSFSEGLLELIEENDKRQILLLGEENDYIR